MSTAEFPGELNSVGAARRFVREELAAESPAVIDAAALIVSELVTNAVLHATSHFDITVRTAPSEVRLDVTDWGPGDPAMRSEEATALGGRGLRIVNELARKWGWNREGPAKTVWAVIHR